MINKNTIKYISLLTSLFTILGLILTRESEGALNELVFKVINEKAKSTILIVDSVEQEYTQSDSIKVESDGTITITLNDFEARFESLDIVGKSFLNDLINELKQEEISVFREKILSVDTLDLTTDPSLQFDHIRFISTLSNSRDNSKGEVVSAFDFTIIDPLYGPQKVTYYSSGDLNAALRSLSTKNYVPELAMLQEIDRQIRSVIVSTFYQRELATILEESQWIEAEQNHYRLLAR